MGPWGWGISGEPAKPSTGAPYTSSRSRELSRQITATATLPLGWLDILRGQPFRAMRGNLDLSGSPKHTFALVPWRKGFGFIAQLPSC